MTNAERILHALDSRLNAPVELTLYGRAALQLGFENPPVEFAKSRDVDAVLWLGQAEELAASTNFWEAIDQVNEQFAEQELFISHLFTEDQVILRPNWRNHCVAVRGVWNRLRLTRLGDLDLLLSKLMRDDALDQADARFIAERARLTRLQVESAIRDARVPDVPEIRDQFARSAQRFLSNL
jgi:hypothetical protein